jgi:hypothetical protein
MSSGAQRSTRSSYVAWTAALRPTTEKIISLLLSGSARRAALAWLGRRRRNAEFSWDGPVVSVPQDATVNELQRTWAGVRHQWSSSSTFLVDLSECRFSDVAGLAYLISRVVERHRKDLDTLLELPSHSEMVNFLREFRFHEALESALGIPLAKVLTERSLIQLATPDATPTLSTQASVRPSLPFNHFPLRMLRLGFETRHIEAMQYATSWLSKHVVSALDRDISGYGSQIAKYVILETLMYASARRRTRTALVGAHFGVQVGGVACLQIVFWWDDGSSPDGDDSGEFPVAAAPEIERPRKRADLPGGSRQAAREVLALAANEPESALAPLAVKPFSVRDLNRIPGGLSALGTAIHETFGGRLDVFRRQVHLSFGVPQPQPRLDPATSRVELSDVGDIFGTFVVITIPMRS